MFSVWNGVDLATGQFNARSLPPMAFAPQNTTCCEGDSPNCEAASYLLAGESAKVIGRNQEGAWLGINNPDCVGICWILRSIVKTEGDIDDTRVIIPPTLP